MSSTKPPSKERSRRSNSSAKPGSLSKRIADPMGPRGGAAASLEDVQLEEEPTSPRSSGSRQSWFGTPSLVSKLWRSTPEPGALGANPVLDGDNQSAVSAGRDSLMSRISSLRDAASSVTGLNMGSLLELNRAFSGQLRRNRALDDDTQSQLSIKMSEASGGAGRSKNAPQLRLSDLVPTTPRFMFVSSAKEAVSDEMFEAMMDNEENEDMQDRRIGAHGQNNVLHFKIPRAQYKRDLTIFQFMSRDLVYFSCAAVFFGVVVLCGLIAIDHNNRNQPKISMDVVCEFLDGTVTDCPPPSPPLFPPLSPPEPPATPPEPRAPRLPPNAATPLPPPATALMPPSDVMDGVNVTEVLRGMTGGWLR